MVEKGCGPEGNGVSAAGMAMESRRRRQGGGNGGGLGMVEEDASEGNQATRTRVYQRSQAEGSREDAHA